LDAFQETRLICFSFDSFQEQLNETGSNAKRECSWNATPKVATIHMIRSIDWCDFGVMMYNGIVNLPLSLSSAWLVHAT
jgi:hypothetical protein